MKKRMIITLAALFALIAGIGMVKFFQIKAAIARAPPGKPPPEAVTTIVGARRALAVVAERHRSVVAVHGVTVSADLPGIVEGIDFESAAAFVRGTFGAARQQPGARHSSPQPRPSATSRA